MDRTYTYVELIGTSSVGYKEAINNGIATAKKKHATLRWFELIEQRGYIGDDGVAYFQAHLKIGYSE